MYESLLLYREECEYSHLSWSQIGPAIFTFVIAVQTFCLLFFSLRWSDRTCHIIHIVAWGFLLFVLCIENVVIAQPDKGPYYGISPSGFWCWVSPQYLTERYTSDYLYMLVSTVFCIILYSLVFFRLRGNISVSGYKVSVHRRPDIRIGRTSNGALVATGDRRIESYLDTVAKHMLWYPFLYIIIVVPILGVRYASFSGLPSYPGLTLAFAALLNLHGFLNTVLFCTTRNILPPSWRQRFGPKTTQGARPGGVYPSGRTNESTGTDGTGTVLVIHSIGGNNDIKTKNEAELSNV